MQRVLFIGLVWPEPTSSAAGWRILQLMELFVNAGAAVTFASAASQTDYSYPFDKHNVQTREILLNDPSFDAFVAELQPQIVVFDRFVSEEQYGWRVRAQCADSLCVLDTEDLHFVRAARQEASSKGIPVNYHTDLAKREIASIMRCDLSLIISSVELNILDKEFHVPPAILYYLPFLEEPIDVLTQRRMRGYQDREHLMFIGNFLHEPNWKTVRILKEQVWPKLKGLLPGVQLHIYGAYASQKVQQLHQPKDRFYIMNRADDARATMGKYRVLVAPIPFGAGVKGKFIDAMQSGTPNVTSSIGAEAMYGGRHWNGVIADDIAAFVDAVVSLYTSEKRWAAAQATGVTLLNENFSKELFTDSFLAKIVCILEDLYAHRRINFMGQILNSQQLNSSKYMSLWIQEKTRNKPLS
ncbi:glycosyltransferase [Sphingobacterium sp. JB170]|uniref:glycosyltransferase n=1 Tax=Sphingobacterium sp. JB170 TaxID=1434842 RepID=UPI00097F4718|nr:glycosyltransferase [Sphingobacterium sp. JB170]SJN42129.1 glycosyl transferase, group 1 [Sphingobacterium sp. JB170]